MRDTLVERLRCPIDLAGLTLHVTERGRDGHVIRGCLKCEACPGVYPIEGGVPDLAPDLSAQAGESGPEKLKAATSDRFGYEWIRFKDWGWIEEYPDVPNAEEKFYGGLVELIVNAMTDIREPFIRWEWH